MAEIMQPAVRQLGIREKPIEDPLRVLGSTGEPTAVVNARPESSQL